MALIMDSKTGLYHMYAKRGQTRRLKTATATTTGSVTVLLNAAHQAASSSIANRFETVADCK